MEAKHKNNAELAERLREKAYAGFGGPSIGWNSGIMLEAADAIEKLEEENDQLRAALNERRLEPIREEEACGNTAYEAVGAQTGGI